MTSFCASQAAVDVLLVSLFETLQGVLAGYLPKAPSFVADLVVSALIRRLVMRSGSLVMMKRSRPLAALDQGVHDDALSYLDLHSHRRAALDGGVHDDARSCLDSRP